MFAKRPNPGFSGAPPTGSSPGTGLLRRRAAGGSAAASRQSPAGRPPRPGLAADALYIGLDIAPASRARARESKGHAAHGPRHGSASPALPPGRPHAADDRRNVGRTGDSRLARSPATHPGDPGRRQHRRRRGPPGAGDASSSRRQVPRLSGLDRPRPAPGFRRPGPARPPPVDARVGRNPGVSTVSKPSVSGGEMPARDRRHVASATMGYGRNRRAAPAGIPAPGGEAPANRFAIPQKITGRSGRGVRRPRGRAGPGRCGRGAPPRPRIAGDAPGRPIRAPTGAWRATDRRSGPGRLATF